LAEILERAKEEVKPGVDTLHIERKIREWISKSGFKAAMIGCEGYSHASSICFGSRGELVHCPPSEKSIVCSGDYITIDVAITDGGYFVDSAVLVEAGEVEPAYGKVISLVEEALRSGISRARAGLRIGDISYAIQSIANYGLAEVTRKYSGHTIGEEFHMDPLIPCFGLPGRGEKIKANMTFAVEPLIISGSAETEVDEEDGWTVKVKGGHPCAHLEHTVYVTDYGDPVVLTTLV